MRSEAVDGPDVRRPLGTRLVDVDEIDELFVNVRIAKGLARRERVIEVQTTRLGQVLKVGKLGLFFTLLSFYRQLSVGGLGWWLE